MTMTNTRSAALIVSLLRALTACAPDPTEETTMKSARIDLHEGIAIDGFDPVSYQNGAPLRGLPEYELSWSGQRFRFASAEHRDRFARAPERYVPEYGGHCALAMSFGEVAEGSPTSFSIERGKLYLHNSAITAFLFKYLPGRMRAADQRWSALESKSEATHGKASL